MSALSVTRKADRAVMAARVAELAGEYGLAAWQTSGPRMRGVDVAGPHGLKLTVKFDGGSSQPDVYVLSWHGTEDGIRLNPARFGDVNSFHGHKATDVVHGFASLYDVLACRFLDISEGTAFVSEVPA